MSDSPATRADASVQDTPARPPRSATTLADRLIGHFDHALRACTGALSGTGRAYPAANAAAAELDADERRHAAGLMRVNHAGEIAAQALYHGQSVTARDPAVREAMRQAALEEIDHLQWCRERLQELDDAPSLLDPLWYAGSVGLGAAAGLVSDAFSLGFIVETEEQVVRHLDEHLQGLPDGDHRSRAILAAMSADEAEHGASASAAGAQPLPEPVARAMTLVAKVMTRTAYRV